ncbi:MAG: hypothetical protein QOG68_1816 [Solirubrobacteraceae bacterium]|nr:hypothetical protein [Solirubrobacteraceae bacterium]
MHAHVELEDVTAGSAELGPIKPTIVPWADA